MATNNRDAYYFNLEGTWWGKVNLDRDKYPAAVATALGFQATPPTGNVKIIDNTKALIRTGRLVRAKATVFNGTGDTIKSRTIDILCDVDKVSAANGTIGANQTITLGNGSNAKPWKFGDIRFS